MRKSQLKQSILIVRLSSVGDVVIASPIAKTLKANLPQAKITWIVQPEGYEALKDNPYIDQIICWDKEAWSRLWKKRRFAKLWGEIKTLKKTLHQERFDTAFDLQGLFKSGFITWLSGAKERVGIGSREGSYWFMHKMVSRNIANRTQIGSEYRYLVNQLGYTDNQWDMQLHCSQESIDSANEKIHQLIADESYAVICPFTQRANKQWPNAHWQQFCLRVRGRYHLKTIILGEAGLEDKGDQLARSTGAINLTGKVNLQEATQILSRASLVVGVDNALTHITQSLDTPTIALFGPSCPYLHTGNLSSKILYLDRYCSPCQRKPICGDRYDCMKDITPDKVLTELKLLFKNTQVQLIE